MYRLHSSIGSASWFDQDSNHAMVSATLSPSAPTPTPSLDVDHSPLLWNNATSAAFADDLAVLIQILFWIVVGTVTILTYLHAKRTLFQPMRTEVYKQQIVLLREIERGLPRTDREYLYHYDVHNAILEFGFALRTSYAEDVLAIEDMHSDLLEDIHGVADEPERRSRLNAYTSKWEPPVIKPYAETINENGREWVAADHKMRHSAMRTEKMTALVSWERDSLTPTDVKQALRNLHDFSELDLRHAEEWVANRAKGWFGNRIRSVKQLRYSADVSEYVNLWQPSRTSSDDALAAVRTTIRNYLKPDQIAADYGNT